MNTIRENIYSIFKQYPDTLERYPKGLTNQNWIFTINDETYIYRLPILPINDYCQEQKVIECLKNTDLDVETIYFNAKMGLKLQNTFPIY